MDSKILFLKREYFLPLLFFIAAIAFTEAQKKQIELTDIYEQGQFRVASLGGFNFLKDGISYSKLKEGKIIRLDLASGLEKEIIFDAGRDAKQIPNFKVESYQFSSDENKILIQTNSERLYRYSSFEEAYVFDRGTKQLTRIFSPGKVMYPTISPSSENVAFVYNNDLYFQNLSDGKSQRISKDGQKNKIINGASDWVYEEEFTLTRSFEWSPDGKKLVYIRTDESEVKEFSLEYYRDAAYPEVYTFKYPKVGEKNSKLTVWTYDLKSKKNKKLPVSSDMEGTEGYIPRIHWTKNSQQVCITWINREQNNVRLYLSDVKGKQLVKLYEEKNKYYIDIHDHLEFIDDQNQFLWQSEKDGQNAMYLMDGAGREIKRITPDGMELTNWYGRSADGQRVYFQVSTQRGLERQICSTKLDGSDFKQISSGDGTHDAQFSQGAKLMVHSHSKINTPPIHTIRDSDGKLIRALEENKSLNERLEQYQISQVEILTVPNRHNDVLNALMIKPLDFDPNKKYPVFMYLYGGPGSQQVMNKWNSFRYYGWLQMIAQKGYIVCVVDNRGTGGRGEEFKKITQKQLGKFETEDQIDAARFLASKPYVDGKRIGIFGWSYGGYMSTLCLLKGNDVFKAAIAVAPVTNWKWYDSVYTERYMGTTESNPTGYLENSPVYFADRLKGNFLLVHGMADDNVHFQNSVEMVNAFIHHKKQFETYYYPNRNHGIGGDNATIHLFTKMTQFVYEKI
ncbi:MAG: S9 family peptidase [Saprospiraceae bacterium]|nr:S9 family peptidase [Saprospiraceae bacterium]